MLWKYALMAVLAAGTAAAVLFLCRRAAGSSDNPPGSGPFTGRGVVIALAAGLFLFIMVQSAVERRFTPALFLPVIEGAPQPGRVLCLCLCVLAAFLAAGTKAGRRLRAGLDRLADKGWGRYLLSAVLTALFFLWALRVIVLCYLSNDDVAILRAIARIPSKGLQAAAGTFSHIYLCALIGFFYKIAPEGYWYLGYHLAMLLISLTVLGRCVLLKTRKRGWSALTGCLLHLLMCAALFLYPFSRISFTITSAVAGAAAVALMLCRSDAGSRGSVVFGDVLGVLLLLMCRLQRYNSFECVLCFWALAAAYQMLRAVLRGRDGLLRKLLSFVPALLAAVILFQASTPGQTAAVDPEYRRAEYYRAIVTDYMMEDLTPEQWESVGIPAELGNIVRNWYFMDERINTDTFKALTDLYYTGAALETEDAPGPLERIADELLSSGKLPLTLGLFLLLLLLLLTALRDTRTWWPEILCSLGAAGGAAILWIYLILAGRFPSRVYMVVVIPAAVILLLLVLTVVPRGEKDVRSASRWLTRAVAAAVCVCVGAAVWNVPNASRYADRADLFSEQWAVEDYANEHAEIEFVTNLSASNLDPLHGAYTYPRNTHLWGGVGVTASSDRWYARDLFRDDIRLMYQYPSTIVALFQYLTLDNGPVQGVLDAQLTQDVYVADLDRVTPGDDYTGWYEQNGMTYYFENGQAVSGTKVIDGTEYTFAPGGQAAALVILPGESLIYTTNAYSLVEGGP